MSADPRFVAGEPVIVRLPFTDNWIGATFVSGPVLEWRGDHGFIMVTVLFDGQTNPCRRCIGDVKRPVSVDG